ncbi:DNRLRE domain-containing protein [Pseudonocardia xishanensis]|uniref:DNRLRE domain-containing protein n=1 Tax=Pseudonocardia xishanensis TaxID=630995 RepID=UPI0031EA70ED
MTVAATLLPLALLTAVLASPAAAQEPVPADPPSAGPWGAGTGLRPAADSETAPGGTRILTLYSGTVRMDRGAEWQDVDLTLQAGPDGVVRPVAAPHDLTLTPAGPSVRYAGGGSDSLPWPTPLPTPVLDGPRATYPQAAPGYDLEVDATRAGFVASLRENGTPTAPPPPLRLARQTAPATEAASAVDRVVASAPVQGDAPVPFDTTTQTTVRNTDASGDPDLRVGSYDGVEAARSYLTFDLAEAAGTTVGRATLDVYQTWSASCRPSAWEVWSLGAPVGPALRWANQPAPQKRWASSTDTRGNAAACAAGWSTVDVTDLVRGWVAAGATSGTVVLKAADETDPLSWKRFASAETATVPRLTVTAS